MADTNNDNSLEMSDEEFLKSPTPTVSTPAPAPSPTAAPVSAPAASPVAAPAAAADDTEVDEPGTPEEPDEDEGGEADDPTAGAADDATIPPGSKAGAGTKDGEAARQGELNKDAGDKPAGETDPNKSPEPADKKGAEQPDPATPNEPVDYEKAYKDLMAPFKANGRDIQPQTPEDVRQLMQMGANYNKKMQALKPHLKVIKMLENNSLLDESKLSFLIDLDKKNPEAISKLLKDSGIDPMDIDAEQAKGYKPGTYKVDDREIELDAVLDELNDSPTFQRTITIVGKEWDQTSRDAIAQAPQVLKLINTHVERGIYDIITNEIARERALGRLTGLNDFQAYRQVGDQIDARGGFDHLAPAGVKGQQNEPAQKIVAPSPKKADDVKLNDKRRAASMSRPAAAPAKTASFNPLEMSDADYLKLGKTAHLM